MKFQLALAFGMLASGPALGESFTEDFESSTPGALPDAPWADASTRIDAHGSDPTATIVATTDAFGNPTQAVLIDEFFGLSQGVLAPIGLGRTHELTVDVKIDHYSDGVGWPIGIGFIKDEGADDLNVDSQAVLYAWTDRQWHFFVKVSPTGPAQDFVIPGPAIVDDHWYTLNMTVDAIDGVFGVFITDTATGDPLGGGFTPAIGGWVASAAEYDAVAIFDGEADGSGSIGGRAYADNVEYIQGLAADINDDCVVDTADLGALIGAFGDTGGGPFGNSIPFGDINADLIVDTADLGLLIGEFGAVCP